MVLAIMLFAANTAQAQLFKRSEAEFTKATLVVSLQSPIGTANSRKGDTFTALVLEPSELVGSIVEGTVARVAPAGAAADKSHLVVQFSTITLPDNSTYRLRANLKDVVNAKGVAKVDDQGQVVAAGSGKKSGPATPATGLAFSEIGPALGSMAASSAVPMDVSAAGANVSFAPGTRFILAAENAGRDKSVNVYRVRQEAATEAARNAAPDPSTSPTPAHAPAAPKSADVASSAATPGSSSESNPPRR
jgi:hypothetical protein